MALAAICGGLQHTIASVPYLSAFLLRSDQCHGWETGSISAYVLCQKRETLNLGMGANKRVWQNACAGSARTAILREDLPAENNAERVKGMAQHNFLSRRKN